MTHPAQRPRLLMIAFACNPAGSGEHWLGWGWAEQAAQFCEVTLLTWNRYAAEIEKAAPALGIKPVCIGVPDMVNRIGDRSGAGRWFRQIIWHRRAAAVAARLHHEQPFQLAHQTTFHTFRIPFRAAGWGIPSIWGPIAGGESCPPGFGPWLGNLRAIESTRKWTNALALAQPAVRRSLRKATVLFVSNHTTLNFLPQWCHERSVIVPPNSLRDDPPPPPARAREAGAPLNLLFVGNCVATRSIPLVLAALKRIPADIVRLTVVGSGAALNDWKKLAAKDGLDARITFTGPLPRTELPGHYTRADAFVFPALRDSGGSGLLEAMSFGLPVVCCDWGGPAEMVNDQCGIKIPVTSPEAAISGFAEAFQKLHAKPEWRVAVGAEAWRRVREEFSWQKKRAVLESAYARCLGGSR
jgi:glycosyltransferase involved in cell wall biosynthesis